MIQGIHHVALRCRDEENYKETLRFYRDLIGMKVKCSWGEGPYAATMLELNGDAMEIFASGAASDRTGSVNHFAFWTDDPDACTEKVRNAGYPIISEPSDVNLRLTEPAGGVYPLRFAYCIGPVGELIEFFCEPYAAAGGKRYAKKGEMDRSCRDSRFSGGSLLFLYGELLPRG